MPIFIAVLVVALAGLLAIGVACSRRSPSSETDAANPQSSSITVKKIKSMSRADLEQMLARIEKRVAPEPRQGAMCYEETIPPERVDYVCTVCGEKTLYAKQWETAVFLERELGDCRRQVGALKRTISMDLRLDERNFCRKCVPEANTNGLALVVRYEDGNTHTCSGVRMEDLLLIRGFLSGKDAYATWNEGEEPIKSRIPRLRELLGLAVK